MTEQTITQFILARADEDRVLAEDAVIPKHNGYKPHGVLDTWRYVPDGEVEYDWDDPGDYPDVYRVTHDYEGLSAAVDPSPGRHIARHDPARVLAQCAAYRTIVELHELTRDVHRGGTGCARCGTYDIIGMGHGARELVTTPGPCPTLRALAAIWSDHPEFRTEWA